MIEVDVTSDWCGHQMQRERFPYLSSLCRSGNFESCSFLNNYYLFSPTKGERVLSLPLVTQPVDIYSIITQDFKLSIQIYRIFFYCLHNFKESCSETSSFSLTGKAIFFPVLSVTYAFKTSLSQPALHIHHSYIPSKCRWSLLDIVHLERPKQCLLQLSYLQYHLYSFSNSWKSESLV